MPLLYGENSAAFLRLQLEIMKQSDDQSIFAWMERGARPKTQMGLLAGHPSAFTRSQTVVPYHERSLDEPYGMTNKGLSITLDLAETDHPNMFEARFRCRGNRGQVAVLLENVNPDQNGGQYARVRCGDWASVMFRPDKIVRRSIYVQQYLGNEPALARPPRGTRIALVRLLPTYEDSSIELQEVVCDLRVARYTALSYVPTRTTLHQSIKVNGHQYVVTDEVFNFLEKAKHPLRGDLFWIYDICNSDAGTYPDIAGCLDDIDQVFGHADKVSIWLDEPNTDLAVGAMISSKPGKKRSHALEIMSNDPYWNQSSVVEYWPPSKEVYFETNQHTLGLGELSELYSSTAQHSSERTRWLGDMLNRLQGPRQRPKRGSIAASTTLDGETTDLPSELIELSYDGEKY